MPLSVNITTSKYAIRRVKTLPSNTAIAFIEEIYEEGFGPESLVRQKQNEIGMIRFETKKSQYPSGKYLNYTLVKERITPIQGVKIKGITNVSELVELESLSYSISKGVSISGGENSFSGSVVYGKPLQQKKDKESLSTIEIRLNGKGIKLLEGIFNTIKKDIDYEENESTSFSTSEDSITQSATLEVKQNKYANLKSLDGTAIGLEDAFYRITTEASSFDGSGNVLGSIIKTYKPKLSTASLEGLKGLLERDIKSKTPPSKIFKLLKDAGFSYKTKESFYNTPISAQYNIDGASLNGTSTVVFTNASNILTEGFVSNTTEEIIDQEIPKGKKINVRSTVIGLENNTFKINNNKKFDGAMKGFDKILQKYGIAKDDLNKHDEIKIINIGSDKCVLTNFSAEFGISDGSISLSFSAEKRFDLSDNQAFLYLNASWLEPKPVHWANSFLIIGGEGGKGEELMQDSKQSRPLEYVLRFNATMRKYNDAKTGFGEFLKKVKNNKRKILKSASCTYNSASKTLDGTAVFIEFDKHRPIKDDSIQSTQPQQPKQ